MTSFLLQLSNFILTLALSARPLHIVSAFGQCRSPNAPPTIATDFLMKKGITPCTAETTTESAGGDMTGLGTKSSKRLSALASTLKRKCRPSSLDPNLARRTSSWKVGWMAGEQPSMSASSHQLKTPLSTELQIPPPQPLTYGKRRKSASTPTTAARREFSSNRSSLRPSAAGTLKQPNF